MEKGGRGRYNSKQVSSFYLNPAVLFKTMQSVMLPLLLLKQPGKVTLALKEIQFFFSIIFVPFSKQAGAPMNSTEAPSQVKGR